MGAFLLRFLAFLSVATAALTIAAAVLPLEWEQTLFARRSSEHDTYRRIPDFRDLARDGGPELLILGPSTGYLGIDPAPFSKRGQTTFNLCSAMQTLAVSDVLLDWALDRGARPKVILLDVYPRLWHQSSQPSTDDLVINRPSPLDGHFLELAARFGSPRTLLNALYFHLRDRIQAPSEWAPQPHRYDRGHTHSRKEVTAVKHFNPKPATWTEENRAGFRRLRKQCAERGIQLILAVPPLPCWAPYRRPDMMQNLPWIEGNDWPLAKVDTLYYDDHHLRGVGAELYSEWLAAQVEAVLTDAPATAAH